VFIPLYDSNPWKHVTLPYVNYAIMAVTALAFFLTGGSDISTVERAALSFGLVPSAVHDIQELPAGYALIPETATYVTYAFLHANLMHLLGNLIFLWVFGDNVEDAVGHVRYLVFYLACAAAAGLAHSYIDPASPYPLVGASGAVAGIVGAYLVLHPRVKLWILVLGRIPLRLSAGWVLAAWALFQVVNLFLAVPEDGMPVAWWAHVGGFCAGAVLILVMRRRGVPLFDRHAPAEPVRTGS
jgi:membrane associated rhomboid family serine protease